MQNHWSNPVMVFLGMVQRLSFLLAKLTMAKRSIDYVHYRIKTLRVIYLLQYASEYVRMVMIQCPRPMT
jgi:hypothetical protein